MKKIILFLSIMFFIEIINAVPNLDLNLKPLDAGNNVIPNTAFDYVFNITLNSNCTNVLLTYNTTIVTIPDGTSFVSINISNLTSIPRYICIFRDGVSIANISFSDLILNSLRVRNIYTENITSNDWSNVTINESQISDLRNYLLNSSEENLNVNSSFYWNNANVTNSTQFSITNFILSLSPTWLNTFINMWLGTKTTNDLTEGTINKYDNRSWNESHANTLYSKYYPRLINLTTITYYGNLTNGTGISGYNAGNKICNATFLGSHLCNIAEIMEWYAKATSFSMADGSQAWIITGGSKYNAGTSVNDCNGFTNSSSSYLGSYWNFNQSTGGDGRTIGCNNKFSLSCCYYG